MASPFWAWQLPARLVRLAALVWFSSALPALFAVLQRGSVSPPICALSIAAPWPLSSTTSLSWGTRSHAQTHHQTLQGPAHRCGASLISSFPARASAASVLVLPSVRFRPANV